MKKLFILISILISINSWASPITEERAISKLNQFFELLDVEVYKQEDISKILSKDFQIFEMGKPWSMEEFDIFLQEAAKTTVSTDWVLSEYEVSIDNSSVHISYVNNGIFKTINNETIYSHWLESIYMVLDNGELKLKFLQSDLVDREIK
jgi:hypothetical protein